MVVTITVPDPLAAILTTQAEQQEMSVENLAAKLLARVLAGDDEWDEVNHERLALLSKSAKSKLTPEEATRLQQLQVIADRRLESLDIQRLAEVKRMEQEVKAALQEAG